MNIPEEYIEEIIKNYRGKPITPEMIKKDLALSYILQEIGKHRKYNENSPFHKLIFKGGTLLAKSHLNYHRISEDLDFTYKHNNELNQLSKSKKSSEIKKFLKNEFLPELKNICEKYNFDFDSTEINRQNEDKYCSAKSPNYLAIFKVYLNSRESNPIKVEINFCDEPFYNLEDSKIHHLHSSSENLVFPLEDFDIESYNLDEVLLEKLRAIITRKWTEEKNPERDVYDLFLLYKIGHNIFEIDSQKICEKIKQGIGYRDNKKEEKKHILDVGKRLDELEKNLEGEINDMNLTDYDSEEYREFFSNIKKFILQFDFKKNI